MNKVRSKLNEIEEHGKSFKAELVKLDALLKEVEQRLGSTEVLIETWQARPFDRQSDTKLGYAPFQGQWRLLVGNSVGQTPLLSCMDEVRIAAAAELHELLEQIRAKHSVKLCELKTAIHRIERTK